MSLFKRKITNQITSQSLPDWINNYINSGIPTNTKNLWAVYSCVNVIGETMGSLPLPIYKNKKDGSKERLVNNEVNDLILKPNTRQTRFDFFEEMIWHLALRGKYFAVKNGIGKNLKELLPVSPDNVIVDESNYYHPTYTIDSKKYEPKDLLIVYMHNGDSVISSQKGTFDLAKSLNRYSNEFFKNGARPSGVIETDNKMEKEAFERFKKQWEDFHSGINNVGKTAILDQGKKYKPLALSNVDAQFLEFTKKSDVEICGIFRVPPHMIGILDNATFSNIENQSLNFTKYTMSPWCKRIELAITQQIIKPILGKDCFCEFNMDALERADISSRYKAYNTGKMAGFLSTNEIRKKENMNPVENGDEYLIPANMNIAGGDKNNENKE